MQTARKRWFDSLAIICIAMVVSVLSAACHSTSASTAAGATVTVTDGSPATSPSPQTTSPVEGTWSGPVLTIAQAEKFVPKKYRAHVFRSIIPAEKTVQFQLRIGDGRLTQLEADDGHEFQIEQAGNITISGHLIHVLDDGGSVYTYRWNLSPGYLYLEVERITATPTEGVPDSVFQHLIYESQPFRWAS